MQELMSSKGIKAYRTNEDGAVFASTDGKGLIVGNFKSSRKISR